MTYRTERLCMWCLPLGLVFISVGWIASGYFPPPSPAMSAHEFQAFYSDHTTGMRIGLSLMAIGGTLTAPFTAAVTSRMLRIEGRPGALAYTQLAMGTVVVTTFTVPVCALMVASFRPDSDPDLIRMLGDWYWLPLVMSIWPSAGQALAMGALAFRAPPGSPLPRWFGYACLWLAAGMWTTVVVLFFKTGPFSPRGLIGLWVPAIFVYLWYVVSMVVFSRLPDDSDDEVRGREGSPEPVAGG